AGGQAEDVNRPGARAEVPQAVADGRRGERLRRPGRLERREPERELGGERGGVGAAGAVSRAVRMPLPWDQVDRLAVEEHVGDLFAVSTGDHDHVRAEPV